MWDILLNLSRRQQISLKRDNREASIQNDNADEIYFFYKNIAHQLLGGFFLHTLHSTY